MRAWNACPVDKGELTMLGCPDRIVLLSDLHYSRNIRGDPEDSSIASASKTIRRHVSHS